MPKRIQKVVIPAAGLGTRLLTVTKEQPKEMLPIFAIGRNGMLCVKPLLQVIFEQLWTVDFRNFCFVVGREKRSIVDHFTADRRFVEMIERSGHGEQAADLEWFYQLLDSVEISWVNQPEPLGFGHALLTATQFVGKDHFLVHAGDTYIFSRQQSFLKRLVQVHEESDASATLVLLRVPPTKGYGFAVADGKSSTLRVRRVVEKPSKPPSNLAIMPIYLFSPEILLELKRVKPGVGGEIQLTDGIQRLVDGGHHVQAILLSGDETRLDIGKPALYWEALRFSYRNFRRIAHPAHTEVMKA